MNNVVHFPLSIVPAMDLAIAPLEPNRPTQSIQAERDIANLRVSYQEHMRSGNQLNRMVSQCREQANVCFETAERIREQLTSYGVQP